ncbi:alanine racemase, partial [candidate division KSB1 bacterium]|nr:alanine racemase [candidate division KSB1 bacterium]
MRNSIPSSVLRPSWVEIDLDAIEHNVEQIRARLGAVQLLVVVKADAYGLGAVAVSRVLQECRVDRLGVVCLDEAVQLRRAGIELPILNMGAILPQQADVAVEYGIEQIVFDLETARALSVAARQRKTRAAVHLKIDTGMSRYGLRFDSAAQAFAPLHALPHLDWVGAMSHFANSDGLDKSFPLLQLSRFLQVRRELAEQGMEPPIWHICNSGGTCDLPQAHLDLVRVGLMVYGYYPDPEVGRPFDLRPALALKSTVITIRELQRGDSVGYGRRYLAKNQERIAILPIGYADGFDRKLRDGGQVLLHGQRVPIVGGLCMDACFICIEDIPEARCGDQVTLMGREGDLEISPHDIAAQIGSVSYEVMARLG